MRSAVVGIGSNSVRALVVETTGESFVRLWRGREGTPMALREGETARQMV